MAKKRKQLVRRIKKQRRLNRRIKLAEQAVGKALARPKK